MQKIITYFLTIFFSLIIVGISFWTYNQSVYHEKIRKNFYELSFAGENPVSGTLALIKGTAFSDKLFKNKNDLVILEKYKQEVNKNKTFEKWEQVKGSDFFKIVPFKLISENRDIYVNPYGFEQSFIGNQHTEVSVLENGDTLKSSLWQIKPGDTVYILGILDNSSGNWVINNPNIQKSLLNFWNKEPYIITLMEPEEVINKATETGFSILIISIALFIIGIFFSVTSIINILKTYRKEIKPYYNQKNSQH